MSSRLGVVFTLGALLAGLFLLAPDSAHAGRGDRTLKLYFTHTKERGEFTFRRNGRYDKKELERINVFLRDWRRGEPTKMDPQLIDLIWEVYQQTGSNDYIHVVSAYRSQETNNALRSRSRGVAQRSQHTRGKALDFFIPGVPVAKLRAIGLRMQRGGVGYYPSSGSPFVHLDTGSVRHWPRMTRQQLVAIFPEGETLHVPSDGKPLPGYERAAAKYKSGVTLAAASASAPGKSKDRPVTAWLKDVFGGGADEEEDVGLASAPAAKPAPVRQPAAPAQARQPAEPVVAARPAPAEVEPQIPAVKPGRAEPKAPVEPEPPSVMPAPRPAVPEIAVAAVEAKPRTEVAGAPLPREAPLVVRQILLAANERATEMAAAPVAKPDAEPQMTAVDAIAAQAAAGSAREAPAVALAFASVPKGRPARKPPAQAAAAAGGGPVDALDALYATSQGANPEGGPLPAEGSVAEDAGDPEELLAARTEAMKRLAAIDFNKPLTGLPLRSEAEIAVEEEAPRPQLVAASLSLPLDEAEAAAGEGQRPAAGKRRLRGLSAGKLAAGDLPWFMSERNARTDAFAVLAMPSPAGAHGLFAAAEDATSVQSLAGADGLRTDRFARP